MKRRVVIVVAAAALVLVLLLDVLHVSAVPIRKFPFRYWEDAAAAKGQEVAVDPAINRMIAHAKRDYCLAPLPGRRAKLSFVVARTVPPNDIYLFFSRTDSEELVVYRGARENGRLLWKAIWNRFD